MNYWNILVLFVFPFICFAQEIPQEPYDFEVSMKNKWCEKAFNSLEEGRYEVAHAYFTVAIELDSTFIVPYMGRIQAKKMAEDREGTLEDYQKLVEIDAHFQSIDLTKGKRDSTYYAILDEYGYYFSDAPAKWDTMLYASKDFEKPLSQSPSIRQVTYRTPYERGIFYLSEDKLDKALQNFNKALEDDPYLAEGYLQRAKTQTLKGQFKEAIKDYNKALRLQPSYGEVYFFRANTYLIINELFAALMDFNRTLKIAPNNAEAYFGRARTHGHLKNYKLALRDYDQALELKPSLTKVYLYRGILHQKAGFIEKACQDWEKAMEKQDKKATELWKKYCQ